jgi:hypothetical protein
MSIFSLFSSWKRPFYKFGQGWKCTLYSLYSVSYRVIFKRRKVRGPHWYKKEKKMFLIYKEIQNGKEYIRKILFPFLSVQRVGLPAVAQLNSYGGSWKWVSILTILAGSVQLLSANCFCIPSYVHQQLHSLDFQNFVHYNFPVFFISWCWVSFLKETYNFQNSSRRQSLKVCALKCTEKRFTSFTPLHILPYRI